VLKVPRAAIGSSGGKAGINGKAWLILLELQKLVGGFGLILFVL